MKNKLKDSLFASGLIEEGSPDKIKAFKKQYHKNYASAYMKQYEKKTKRKTLVLSLSEFSFLQEQADERGLKLSIFLKECIFAYLESSFVVPSGKTLSNIESLLREINQRVAESIQYVHMNERIELSDIEKIKKRIHQLEFFISNTLDNPIRLENWISDRAENDKNFLPKLHRAIANYITLHL